MISSFCVDVNCYGKDALVAEAYGRAILLGLAPEGLADGARTEARFSLHDAESRYLAHAVHAFGALFAGRNHDYVIFGAVGGRVLSGIGISDRFNMIWITGLVRY